MAPSPHYRVGFGWDRHLWTWANPERPLVLGGVTLPDANISVIAHSDGDVVLHAITDAILGALGEPDIGEIFPNTDPQWNGASSDQFLTAAVEVMQGKGGRIGNVDVTIIVDDLKISPHKAAMIELIATLLGCGMDQVNVKGKTTEIECVSMDEASIDCHAVVLIEMGGDGR
jgi:2-C-methyl-D-erythritol 2,4-cyclodiphosphate synthase